MDSPRSPAVVMMHACTDPPFLALVWLLLVLRTALRRRKVALNVRR